MNQHRRHSWPGPGNALAAIALVLLVFAATAATAGVCSFVIILGIIETPDPMEHAPVGDMVPWAGSSLDGDVDLDLAFAGPDRAFAVWSDPTGADRDVKFAEWSGGKWMPAVVLGSTPADEVDPAVAVGADGAVHVVWAEAVEPFAILGTSRNGQSGKWGRIRVLATGGHEPDVIASGSRRALAFESRPLGTGVEIRAAVETASGAFPTTVIAVSQASSDRSLSLGSAGGNLWVQWQHTDESWAVAEYAGDGWWRAPKTQPWDDTPWPAGAVVEAVD